MKVIFSDLDGALVGGDRPVLDAAHLAFDALQRRRVPLVLCTGKTRTEAEYWRKALGIDAPFIVENGGAVYFPTECFSHPIPGAVRKFGYDVVEFGDPYPDLVRTLERAANESGCRITAFHDMSIGELSTRTRLPATEAERAKRREYDEPFLPLGSNIDALLRRIEAHGKRWSRGRTFFHIRGRNDKAEAIRLLIELYHCEYDKVTTVGLGYGAEDFDFLRLVDKPVLVRSPTSVSLRQALPRCRVSASPGLCGWNEAVLEEIGLPGTQLGGAFRAVAEQIA